MSHALNAEIIRDQMVPLAVTLGADPIPNIRFNAAKSMGVMIPLLKKANMQPTLNDKLKPTLQKMTEDSDMDVRYYAQQSLTLL
jgi:serine/threonine-protein phosphatase 2A regulatory subunit A